MKKFLFIGLVLAVLFSGCIIPPDPDPDLEYPIRFTSIERDQMSGIQEKTFVVANTQEEWEELYSRIHLRDCGEDVADCGPMIMPYVDFEKNTVVAVFMGEKPYPLFRLEVEKVTRLKQADGFGHVKVYVNEIETIPGDDVGIPAVMVQPYEIIVIEKTESPIKVVRKEIREYESDEGEIRFTSVEKGQFSAIKEKTHEVVNNQDDFKRLYNKIHATGCTTGNTGVVVECEEDLAGDSAVGCGGGVIIECEEDLAGDSAECNGGVSTECEEDIAGSAVGCGGVSTEDEVCHPIIMPYINFEKNTVIAVFLGEYSQEYTLEINKLMGSKSFVTVYVNEIFKPLPDDIGMPIYPTQPYEIISIPKTKLPVKVVRTEITGTDLEQLVDFSSVEKGTQCNITERMHKSFNDEAEFLKFYYNEIHGLSIPVCSEEGGCENSQPFPPIDFSKETVIAVFLGEKPNPLYGMEIRKVTSSKTRVKVYATETYKKLGEGEAIIQITVQPYEIIRIPKTYSPISVVWLEQDQPCAGVGEKYSKVYTEYPSTCCLGLTEWRSGMDTSISVAGNCYETGKVAGSPIGTCLACGDGVCDELEDVCNCPKDCSMENSDYETLEEFCSSSEWASIQRHCGDPLIEELCNICDYSVFTIVDDSEFLDQECDAQISCPADYECASFPLIGLKCYPTTTTNPCDFVECGSGECVIAESYPVQVMCS